MKAPKIAALDIISCFLCCSELGRGLPAQPREPSCIDCRAGRRTCLKRPSKSRNRGEGKSCQKVQDRKATKTGCRTRRAKTARKETGRRTPRKLQRTFEPISCKTATVFLSPSTVTLEGAAVSQTNHKRHPSPEVTLCRKRQEEPAPRHPKLEGVSSRSEIESKQFRYLHQAFFKGFQKGG